jgi:hypothetical protein
MGACWLVDWLLVARQPIRQQQQDELASMLLACGVCRWLFQGKRREHCSGRALPRSLHALQGLCEQMRHACTMVTVYADGIMLAVCRLSTSQLKPWQCWLDCLCVVCCRRWWSAVGLPCSITSTDPLGEAGDKVMSLWLVNHRRFAPPPEGWGSGVRSCQWRNFLECLIRQQRVLCGFFPCAVPSDKVLSNAIS